jgi:hypothetical protein
MKCDVYRAGVPLVIEIENTEKEWCNKAAPQDVSDEL